MTTFLPKEVQDGLDAARKASLKSKSRLRIRDSKSVYSVLRFWDTGFSLEAEHAPHLRGYVDLMDGARHLSRCLIVASEEVGDEILFEFKHNTAAQASAPLDFYRDENAPIALLR